METLTIKLLHERRSNSNRRKIDGYSGKVYPFIWNPEHDGYCFTTSKQEEADDLFNAQGRRMGSYFAPIITLRKPEPAKPLSPELTSALTERGIALPDVAVGVDSERIALAVLAAFDQGVLRRAAIETVKTTVEVAAPASPDAPASGTAPTNVTVRAEAPAAAPKHAGKKHAPAKTV